MNAYLSNALKDFKSDNEWYSGYLEGDGQYTTFIYSLKRLGYSFATRDSRKFKEDKDKTRFVYSHDWGDVHIAFVGSPFHLTDVISMECSQGPKRATKPTPAIPQELADHPSTTKRRHALQPTKRIGCPAKLLVKGIRLYTDPEYKKSLDGLKKNSRQHHKMMDKLKQEFKDPTNTMKTCDRFYIKMSKEECHSHPTISTNLSQIIHPKLKKKILALVKRNVCSTKMIKMQLDECVRDMCKEDSSMPLPNALNRCFYPTEKTIYNAMYSAIFQMKKSKYDQEALEELIKGWVKESPEDKFFFRPFKDNGEKNEYETVDTLLCCFQTKWQQDLMKRYGNNIALLDATYKTTKYALPLFFVAVKTNASYCVVATFVVQSEAASKIKEALSIISSWNEDWKPLYFMTDYSEAEINAIEEVFPDASVHLCSFHREQSWHRWLTKSGNIRTGEDKAIIKKLWRGIAKSRTVEKYAECLDAWKDSEVCSDNPKAQQYFAREWIPQVHRWVPALQSDDFLWKVETNNGLENQNRVMKVRYLRHWADKTLSGMLQVVRNQFLPDSLTKYMTANAQMNPKYKSYNIRLPNFLHDRPINFIKHVWSRYKAAQTEYTINHIADLGSGMFTVQSEGDSDSHYIVDINNANCSCYDCTKWHLPCKHMCAIFIHSPGVSFEDLPETYRNNPYFMVDVQYSAGIADIPEVVLEPQPGFSSPQDTSSPTAEDVDMSPPVADDYLQRKSLSQLRAKCKTTIELTYTAAAAGIDKIGWAMDKMDQIIKYLSDSANTSVEGLVLLSNAVLYCVFVHHVHRLSHFV